MKLLTCFTCALFIICVQGATFDRWTVKFTQPCKAGGFIDLPRTGYEAEKKNWKTVRSYKSNAFVMYCLNNDPRVCPLYDNIGKRIRGIQFGFPKSLLNETNTYPFKNFPVFESTEMFGQPIYAITVFTKKTGILGFFESFELCIKNGTKSTCFPEDIGGMGKYPTFKESFCMEGMGRHFYNGINSNWTEFAPPFLLYNEETGKLVGGGINTFGGFRDVGAGDKGWFEDTPPGADVSCMIQPKNPDDFSKAIDSQGWTSIHFYGLSPEKARAIPCPKKHGDCKGT